MDLTIPFQRWKSKIPRWKIQIQIQIRKYTGFLEFSIPQFNSFQPLNNCQVRRSWIKKKDSILRCEGHSDKIHLTTKRQWCLNIPTARSHEAKSLKWSVILWFSRALIIDIFDKWSVYNPYTLDLQSIRQPNTMISRNPSYNLRRRTGGVAAVCIAARRSMKYRANKTHLATVARVTITNLQEYHFIKF